MSSVPSVQASPEAVVRHDWTLPEVRAIHDLPLLELVYRAQTVHRATFGEPEVQLCSLLSIKTGGCPEDCAYCPQSARYQTGVNAESLMETGDVLEAAGKARAAGATRICMGAAWREVKDGPQIDRVLSMVSGLTVNFSKRCRANSSANRSSILFTIRPFSSTPKARHSVLWSGGLFMPMSASHCGESRKSASVLR